MKIRAILRASAALVLSLAACLLLAEIVFYFFLPAPRIIPISITTPSGGTYELSPDPILFYVPKPNAGGFNGAGYRGTLYPEKRRPGTTRFVFVGDSVTEGVFVPTGERFTDIFDRRRGRDVEVVNLGVPGYNLPQVTRYLETKGVAYRPDHVVVGVSLDDEGKGPSNERKDLEKKMRQLREKGVYGIYRRARGRLEKALLNFNTYRYLKILFAKGRMWGGKSARGGDRLTDGEIRGYLREMSRVADENGFDLTFVFFAGANGITAKNIRRVAEEEGLTCVDLLPRITERFDSNFYRMLLLDFGHFNRLGHKVVADMLLEYYNDGNPAQQHCESVSLTGGAPAKPEQE